MLPNMAFNDVDLDTLNLLERHETPESRRLEFKEELPLDDKSQRREFCADVSAFANADGGYLLVGIKDGKENEGKPIVRGIPEPPNTDGYISDLENIVKSGVEPNIHGINIKAIDLSESDESRIVLVIFIPSSWSKPHWIGKEKSRSFCSRRSNGKYHLDITEVRQMFLLSETAADRIREFRKSCIEAIQRGATPVSIVPDHPTLVLHVSPYSAGSTGQHYDLSRISEGFNYNFDGIYGGTGMTYYSQVFRTGSVEIVWHLRTEGSKQIMASAIETVVWKYCLPLIRAWYRKLEVFPPYIFMLSLTNVVNYRLVMNGDDYERCTKVRESKPIDRDQLLVPEVIVYNPDPGPEQIMNQLRPAFDAIWQSSGLEGSVNYDEESGEWLRPGT